MVANTVRLPVARCLARAAAWAAGVLVALQLSLALVAVNFPMRGSDVWLLGVVQAIVLGSASLILSHTEQVRLGPVFPVNARLGWSLSALGVGLGIGLNWLASYLRQVIELVLPTSDAEKAFQEMLLRHDTASRIVMLFLVIGVVGPIWEELFYRGVLFQFLEMHAGTKLAVGFSSFTFALTHAAYRDWVPLLLVALGLGYLRTRSGALLPSALLHITFNCTTLAVLVLGEGGR